jgi:hypothetical protein
MGIRRSLKIKKRRKEWIEEQQEGDGKTNELGI